MSYIIKCTRLLPLIKHNHKIIHVFLSLRTKHVDMANRVIKQLINYKVQYTQ